MSVRDESFLARLLRKQSVVERVAQETGKKCGGAKNEIGRQIKQCLTGKNPISGASVTKSGVED
ncbi:MAG: hypothetical protein H6774_03315 [Pseudomonadales bacterium]|nr:hypothetical protein [Candidatus Woesebacteria bacterium]MCB9802093.1 hypothetical protein [Pseudomonadales bacterium]